MALIPVVLALVAGGPSDAAHAHGDRWRCHHRGVVPACIDNAAHRWHVSSSLLRRRAWCESRWRPGAYNNQSGAAGLFQFLPSTFATTPYRRRSLWSPHWSSMAAAWMQHVGRGGEWSCQ